jgi:hypothetical protein
LSSAPTGSGKTLAAFLWAIGRLAAAPPVDPKERLRVLYVSPLKALAVAAAAPRSGYLLVSALPAEADLMCSGVLYSGFDTLTQER